MKKTGLIFLIVFSIVACQQRTSKTAGEVIEQAATDSTNVTTIHWIDSTFQDLGKVKEGPEVDISFHFKNTGEKNLVIEDVAASCGCTIPEKPQEPFAPGQEGTIHAKFTTAGHPNQQEKTITVKANTAGSRTHILTFKIFVEPKS